VDRSLGGKIIPRALEARGWKVKRHDKHFPQDAEDTAWIYGAGAKGWIIVTADDDIRYNPLEREALQKCGTLAFIFADKGNMTGPEMAAVLIKAEKAIFRTIAKQKPPGVFRVYADGRVAKCYLG
jgi:hypothetical protein